MQRIKSEIALHPSTVITRRWVLDVPWAQFIVTQFIQAQCKNWVGLPSSPLRLFTWNLMALEINHFNLSNARRLSN